MATPLDQARALILQYDFSKVNFTKDFDPEEEEGNLYYDTLRKTEKPFTTITNQILHDSFGYFIDIDGADETPDTLGYSKEGGYPHLPKDWKLPKTWKKYGFLAQFNITEFKHLDLENLFPEEGIIYLFQHFEQGKCHLYFYQGPVDALVERDDIEPINEDESPLEFKPGCIFYVRGENDHKNMYKLIPKDLKQNLERLLQCKLQSISSSWGIQVQPSFWQGEDEDWDDEISEISDKVLLYQTEIDDASIHTWISKSDLKAGELDKAYQTFSGT